MTIKEYEIPDIRDGRTVSSIYIWNNKSYRFEFDWNTRSEDINLAVYYVDANGNETALLKHINVVPGVNLMKYYTGEDFTGQVYIYDTTGYFRQPLFTNIYTDYTIVFLTDDELE